MSDWIRLRGQPRVWEMQCMNSIEGDETFEELCRVLLSEEGELDRLCLKGSSLEGADEPIIERCQEAIFFAASHGMDTRHAELSVRLAETLSSCGQPERGEAVLESAQRVLSESGNNELAAGIGQVLFDSRYKAGCPLEELEGPLLEALAQARQVGGNVYACLLLRYSVYLKQTNQREAAVKQCEEARDVFRSIGDHRGVAIASSDLGGAWHDLGRSDLAEFHLRKALEIWWAVGDPMSIALAQFRLAWGLGSGSSAQLAHRASEALDLLGDARKQYAEDENLEMMAECDMQAALLIATQDGPEKAIPIFERSATLFDSVGSETGLLKARANLAIVHSRRGDVRRAMSIWESVIEQAEKIGDEFYEGVATILLVRELLKCGYVDEGSQMLDHVAEVLEPSDVKEWRAQYWLARAESFQKMKQLRPTREAALKALSELRDTVLHEEHAAVLEVLAWCDESDGKADKAGRLRGEALALYTNIGEREDAHRLAAAIVPPPPSDDDEEPPLPPLSTGVYL